MKGRRRCSGGTGVGMGGGPGVCLGVCLGAGVWLECQEISSDAALLKLGVRVGLGMGVGVGSTGVGTGVGTDCGFFSFVSAGWNEVRVLESVVRFAAGSFLICSSAGW